MSERINENLTELQKQIIRFYHHNTFLDYIHVEIVPTNDGQVRLELAADEPHMNLYGIVHGGVLMTMADTAMGAACMVYNKKVVTISLSMEFMHAVPLTQRILTSATVLHNGSRTMTCECGILSNEGKMFAKAHAIFYVIGKFVETEDESEEDK